MAQGKYSPFVTSKFVPVRWDEGTEGRVEVDANGFDRYGYDANGKDKSGRTEWDYLVMTEDEWIDVCFFAK